MRQLGIEQWSALDPEIHRQVYPVTELQNLLSAWKFHLLLGLANDYRRHARQNDFDAGQR